MFRCESSPSFHPGNADCIYTKCQLFTPSGKCQENSFLKSKAKSLYWPLWGWSKKHPLPSKTSTPCLQFTNKQISWELPDLSLRGQENWRTYIPSTLHSTQNTQGVLKSHHYNRAILVGGTAVAKCPDGLQCRRVKLLLDCKDDWLAIETFMLSSPMVRGISLWIRQWRNFGLLTSVLYQRNLTVIYS